VQVTAPAEKVAAGATRATAPDFGYKPKDDDELLEILGPRFDESAARRTEARPVDAENNPVFLPLSVLVQRPELLQPPAFVIPRLAIRGRATLLVAPDKSGKSTLMAHAASETTKRGRFFGQSIETRSRRVIWAGLEEALGDAVGRFAALGAVPDNIQLAVLQSEKLLEHIRSLARDWNPDVLCLDSLTEYARIIRGAVPEDGDSSGWASVIRPLVGLTREFPHLSAIFAHHPRRSDGQFRGSGEIAAAVDCLLEMRNPAKSEDPCLRHITGRARWAVAPFDIVFRNGGYELAGGGVLSIDARALIHIEENPGISQARLRDLVGGRARDADLAVDGLVQRGVVVDRGGGTRHAYHAASAAGLGLELPT
jgi:hypothetical protein